jgi:hypothetical protein
MIDFARTAVLVVMFHIAVAPAGAQPPSGPLEPGHGLAWASLGFQGDLGGAVNSSGIGVVNGLRAEIDTNTWGERYDAALIFRFGGAYNLTTRSQVFAALSTEQSEADETEVGLIGGRPLTGKFSDYQGWGIDFGYRFFFRQVGKAKPFVGGSLGFQRLQDITLILTAPTTPALNTGEVPFYDDSWVTGWRLGAGILVDINERFGWQATLDLKYSGVLSDQSGIGTVGFERINDVGNRYTLPILGGVFVKF